MNSMIASAILLFDPIPIEAPASETIPYFTDLEIARTQSSDSRILLVEYGRSTSIVFYATLLNRSPVANYFAQHFKLVHIEADTPAGDKFAHIYNLSSYPLLVGINPKSLALIGRPFGCGTATDCLTDIQDIEEHPERFEMGWYRNQLPANFEFEPDWYQLWRRAGATGRKVILIVPEGRRFWRDHLVPLLTTDPILAKTIAAMAIIHILADRTGPPMRTGAKDVIVEIGQYNNLSVYASDGTLVDVLEKREDFNNGVYGAFDHSPPSRLTNILLGTSDFWLERTRYAEQADASLAVRIAEGYHERGLTYAGVVFAKSAWAALTPDSPLCINLGLALLELYSDYCQPETYSCQVADALKQRSDKMSPEQRSDVDNFIAAYCGGRAATQ